MMSALGYEAGSYSLNESIKSSASLSTSDIYDRAWLCDARTLPFVIANGFAEIFFCCSRSIYLTDAKEEEEDWLNKSS